MSNKASTNDIWRALNMADRSADMNAVFNALSEKNQEIIMLVAESVKIAQEVTERAIKAREEKQ